ncbi:hypothetical protein JYU34_004740 [Plutella xylostella]|uniref:BRO1 domain-containing protein n=1 Tax=Plutella xylostella TaxID=51655 RepID=A0ABQ7QYS1_PLUXY|nr:hypothetical protein JYU34_004740 [Plutella xylostella]
MAELLAVPFKKSSDVDIVKPLKNLIQSTYNTEEYSDALTELSRLRSNAIWKIFEKSNLEYLNSYYDQLVSLESKLPPQEVQIPFKWKDAFDKGSIFGGRMSLTLSSLSYERVCILFNMAAAQSALASSQPLDNEESLKLAAKLLQQAAGIFSHLKETVLLALHGEPTPDLAPDTLAALAALMLAQAQEVIAYKCIQDEMKPSMAARVCAGAADLYGDALRALQRDSLRPLWDRDWIPTVTTKQQILSGLAQYFQAAVCQAGGAPGQEIARLTLALKLMPQAKDHPRLQDIYRRCGARLASAQKDNDFIYHERIPEASQLEAIKGAAVAKPLPVQDKYCTGVKDLFEGLAPAAVHRALAASEARKSDAVNAEINKLRDATQLLNSVLASLNLPACVETVAPGSLPASIRGKAAAVRGAGGAGGLRARQAELPALLARNTELLDEAERMLREEEEADNALRAQFGARWTRTASAQLTATFRANADKYRQIIDNAVRADKIVEEKYNQHKESISLLSGSDSELEAGVPRAGGPRADCAALSTLRKLMDDVETLKAERDAIECELKSVTLDMKQQFLTALAASGALDEPALTAAALAAPLTPLRQQVQETVQRQEELLVKIQVLLGVGRIE